MRLILMNEATEKVSHTVVLEQEPYNGEVEIDVVPQTRKLVMQAIDNAKRNPIYNRHSVFDVEKQKKVSRAGRPDDAFMEELAKLLIIDWRGVVDAEGNEVPCTDENKVLLFNNVQVANFLSKAAQEIGVAENAEEEKNS